MAVFALTATLLTGVCLPAFADEQAQAEETQDYGDRLLGDIGGVRSKIAPYGIDLGIVYTADFFITLQAASKQAQCIWTTSISPPISTARNSMD